MGGKPKTRKVMCVETGEIFDSVREACEKYNGNEKMMRRSAAGYTKSHRGKTWRYVDEGDRRSSRHF